MTGRDEVLEFAAHLVEQMSLAELRGIMAKKKRVREDAQLRSATIREHKSEMASLIRSQKGRPDGDVRTLQEIAALTEEYTHTIVVRRAWALMERGLCRIAVTFDCADRVLSPTPAFRVTLTDEGRAALAEGSAAKNEQTPIERGEADT